MTELIAIFGMGVAIIGFQLTTFRFLIRRIDGLADRISSIEQHVARLEGLIQGRREWQDNAQQNSLSSHARIAATNNQITKQPMHCPPKN